MTTILTGIAIYILSAYFMWLHTKIAHSKCGIWSNVSPTHRDIVGIFLPLINTIGLLMWLFEWPYKVNESKFNKFFNIKR